MFFKLVKAIILLGFIPLVLGLPVHAFLKDKSCFAKMLFCYTSGFFFSLVLFELICVPMAYLQGGFRVLTIIYSTLLICMCVGILIYFFRRRNKPLEKIKKYLKNITFRFKGFEILYLIAFFVLLIIQVCCAIYYDPTVNSYDDATYLVYGASAIQKDIIYMIEPYTGMFEPLVFHRVLQSSLIYYGYLAKIIGVSVPTVAHTILNVYLLIMAYSVYYILSEDLFDQQENRFLFMFFVALLYIFGDYSHYSLSFRLLGVLWQGKAILAVVLTPLLFVVLREILSKPYDIRYGLLLLVYSVAAVSLTLMGCATMLIITCLEVILVLYKNRNNGKYVFYMLWAGIVPGIVTVEYLLERFV